MTTDDRLLIPCTRALLEGWTGPVHGYVSGGLPTRAVCIGDFDANGDVYLWTEVGSDPVPPSSLSLDLSRAECRDRVARVLVATYRPARSACTAPDWYWCDDGDDGPQAEPEWTLNQGADLLRWYVPGPARSDHEVSVPALGAVDPGDGARLPDGSRIVDALALAAVWREVSRAA